MFKRKDETSMRQTFSVHIWQDADLCEASCDAIGVSKIGRTEDEALKFLRATLEQRFTPPIATVVVARAKASVRRTIINDDGKHGIIKSLWHTPRHDGGKFQPLLKECGVPYSFAEHTFRRAIKAIFDECGVAEKIAGLVSDETRNNHSNDPHRFLDIKDRIKRGLSNRLSHTAEFVILESFLGANRAVITKGMMREIEKIALRQSRPMRDTTVNKDGRGRKDKKSGTPGFKKAELKQLVSEAIIKADNDGESARATSVATELGYPSRQMFMYKLHQIFGKKLWKQIRKEAVEEYRKRFTS